MEEYGMSRNPEFEFVSMDSGALVAQLIALYEAICGVTVRPGSPERLFIQWVAAALLQERAMENYIGNQNIPSRAEGVNLDALAELVYQQTRTPAVAATVTMRFCISEARSSAVLIPAGTRVTDEGQTLYWETTEDHFIPIGETSVEARARCQTAGTVGNGWTAGQINTLVDIYDYYSVCANVDESDGGADRMTDDELYEAMRLSMDAWSTAGPRGGYIYHAKSVSTEIADVAASSPEPGVVKLYVLMDDGTIASETMKAAVLAACSAGDVRPLTDFVTVEDPETVGYDIGFTYFIPAEGGKSAAEIEAAVAAAVEKYKAWQSARLGRDINPSYLIGLLMQTGIKRVDLRSPAFRPLSGGSGTETPQVARLAGEPEVINGGYENA